MSEIVPSIELSEDGITRAKERLETFLRHRFSSRRAAERAVNEAFNRMQEHVALIDPPKSKHRALTPFVREYVAARHWLDCLDVFDKQYTKVKDEKSSGWLTAWGLGTFLVLYQIATEAMKYATEYQSYLPDGQIVETGEVPF